MYPVWISPPSGHISLGQKNVFWERSERFPKAFGEICEIAQYKWARENKRSVGLFPPALLLFCNVVQWSFGQFRPEPFLFPRVAFLWYRVFSQKPGESSAISSKLFTHLALFHA
ncbi:MAG: hypothetical protein Ct9H300mP11_15460 [Chloroflexota bacterium]|nr:MAG: hypothetical protein Ct9H300mP11_15460 [Chloroflexota bacterium]